jgi:hypothetical protein
VDGDVSAGHIGSKMMIGHVDMFRAWSGLVDRCDLDGACVVFKSSTNRAHDGLAG